MTRPAWQAWLAAGVWLLLALYLMGARIEAGDDARWQCNQLTVELHGPEVCGWP